MVETRLATVKLFRFDPEVDERPWYCEYKVPYEGCTVLDALLYIYENLDSTFAFRWACGNSRCRCCVVLVNGSPVLACVASASRYMTIEPHPKFKIIKDLITDLDKLK